jgi:hypothetical protein
MAGGIRPANRAAADADRRVAACLAPAAPFPRSHANGGANSGAADSPAAVELYRDVSSCGRNAESLPVSRNLHSDIWALEDGFDLRTGTSHHIVEAAHLVGVGQAPMGALRKDELAEPAHLVDETT